MKQIPITITRNTSIASKHHFPFRRLRIVLAIALTLVAPRLFAQQPAYFMLGVDQFRGIQIYDMIQDKELNYWFATNEGIYWFNYVSYEKIECAKAKSNSAFNFVMGDEGTIYCHNLNNQVFEIKDKQCRLFYELSAEEGGADVSLSIANDGNILIGSRKIIVLNKNGQVIKRHSVGPHYLGPSFTAHKKEIHYHLSESDTILLYSKGQFSKHKMNRGNATSQSLHVLKFYSKQGQNFAIDLSSKNHYSYDAQSFSLFQIQANPIFGSSESVRLYQTNSGLWVASTIPGVSYSESNQAATSNKVFFKDYFISDVYEDVEGNILLGTFDKGILVIPDMKVPDVINAFEDDPITSLFPNERNGLILGSSKGLLLSYVNGQINTLSKSGIRPIEVVQGNPSGDWYVFDDGFIRVFNTKTRKTTDILLASLKDAVFISENEVFLGTNRGVVKLTYDGKSTFKIENYTELISRVHFMDFDIRQKQLYVSTANGLVVRTSKGVLKTIKYKGEDLFPSGILCKDGKTYLSTKEYGILVVENDIIIHVIKPMVHGKLVAVKKIALYKGTIIAQSAQGFYQFDMNGKLKKSLHSIFGFTSKRVIDFCFHKGKLWVSHSGGVQELNLNYAVSTSVKPIVRLDKILVNNARLENQTTTTFSAHQRKYQFFFSSPTLRNRETILYHYRLLGNDDAWTITDYSSNQVTYNALAPGNYTFEIKVENRGMFSEVRAYSFTIQSPLYLRWWFITVSALLFIVIVVLIYRWQLTIQRKKSERINELNASKLTAIQSQMNPHFIFNSLNSIQDLILKGDVEHSYSYITTFSNLVRRTLNYSEKDFIDFEQELKLLELYLSLEKLRFKKDFNYEIHYSDVEDIMLPPLLVQPFIENALVHGLLHKEGQKQLTIRFHMEDVLVCIIEDNGIGRKAASEIKQRQRAEHESFSGKAIHHRFEILSNVFDGKFGYTYQDLEENGVAIGTRVILHIPVKRKF